MGCSCRETNPWEHLGNSPRTHGVSCLKFRPSPIGTKHGFPTYASPCSWLDQRNEAAGLEKVDEIGEWPLALGTAPVRPLKASWPELMRLTRRNQRRRKQRIIVAL